MTQLAMFPSILPPSPLTLSSSLIVLSVSFTFSLSLSLSLGLFVNSSGVPLGVEVVLNGEAW